MPEDIKPDVKGYVNVYHLLVKKLDFYASDMIQGSTTGQTKAAPGEFQHPAFLMAHAVDASAAPHSSSAG